MSANDLLQYWADDDRTELVLLYLESFGNARKFSRIAREVSRRQADRGRPERRARRGPTPSDGELPADTLHALFEQTGVIRVDTLSQQLDVARVLACQPLPAGAPGGPRRQRRRVAGAGRRRLRRRRADPRRAGRRGAGRGGRDRRGRRGARVRASTVDLGFEAVGDDLARTLTALLADDGVDSVLAVCAPAPRQSTDDLVAAVAAARAASPDKTLLALRVRPPPGDDRRRRAVPSVPVFDFPDDAAYALGRVTRYARWRGAPEGELVVPRRHRHRRRPGSGSSTRSAVGESGRLELPTGDAADLLRRGGAADGGVGGGRTTPTPRPGRRPRLGYPVAVKAAARTRLAKTEAGGLALDVHDEAELRATLDRMAQALGDATWPVVVQPMAAPGSTWRSG